MTQEKLIEVLNFIKDIDCSDEQKRLMLEMAANTITVDKLGELVKSDLRKTGKVKNRRKGLKFTKKEISKMPTHYKNIFATNDMIVHYRLRKDGVYEARFHRQGIDIEVSSKDLTKLKQKFIDKLNNKDGQSDKSHKKSNKTFGEYADEWINIKKVTTKESTYKEYVRLLNHDLLPEFGEKKAKEIDRSMVQNFLFTYVEKGVVRTAHKLMLMLKCIFDMIADDYGIPTPMRKVVLPNYETKKGSAFTYEEEKKLINHCLANLDRDTSHAFMVLLYTGMRRSELASLNVIDNTWLECETSKERMGKNAVMRRIPFTPMIKRVFPYIDFEKAKNVNLNSLHTAMKRLFPSHHLHELRYTFITRAKECGVHGEVVMLWDGHEEDKSIHSSRIDRGYTDFSDKFLLKEANKVDYLQWDFGEIKA